jgi:LSD1 subclass zinc finger protein
MHVTIPCGHCRRPLNAPREFLGRMVRCAYCNGQFVLNELDSDSDSGSMPMPIPAPKPNPVAVQPSRAHDRTVSRSMLIKIPTTRPATVDAMVCRLEPGTLRLIQASDSFAWFVGPMLIDRSSSLLDFLHQDDRALAEDEFRQAVEHGERHDFVLRVRHEGGDWHYMRIYTQARYEPDGALDHVRASFKDVTDRVHAEQELRRRTEQLTDANERLRQANRKLQEAQGQLVHSEKLAALGTLAAGMAHEINNPLAFATNNMAVLGRDLGLLLEILDFYEAAWPALREAKPEAASAIDQLRDEADLPFLRENLPRLIDSTRRGLGRVARIVKDLRAFAQLDRAAVGVIDVNESIGQGLGLLGGQLERQRIEVIRDFADLPPLECAPAHLNQVFLNLLLNAMQAIEATNRGEGQIRVSTRTSVDGSAIVVEVIDDGSARDPAQGLRPVFHHPDDRPGLRTRPEPRPRDHRRTRGRNRGRERGRIGNHLPGPVARPEGRAEWEAAWSRMTQSKTARVKRSGSAGRVSPAKPLRGPRRRSPPVRHRSCRSLRPAGGRGRGLGPPRPFPGCPAR